MNIYYMINWFFLCSLLGYLLECVVLTYENRTPVLNRGFGHGPFCIIYGFGAIGANLLLSPLADSAVKLYMAAMIMATIMELITARAMIRLFGSFWWDYSMKKFNYKGIICLESSLGWGLLGIVFFRLLNVWVQGAVSRIPAGIGKYVALSLLMFYAADFLYSFHLERREKDGAGDEPVIGRMRVN